jgi:hypothetical protein
MTRTTLGVSGGSTCELESVLIFDNLLKKIPELRIKEATGALSTSNMKS